MKRDQRRARPVFLIVILILVLVFVISGLQFLESTVFHPTGTTEQYVDKTIVRDGISYFPRQDMTVIMLAGIDEDGPVVSSGSYNNPGEADMVTLLVFDETNKKLDVLTLNRDTMLEMPILGIGGKQAGTMFGQLALSHTYGSGLEDSAVNLRTTVSNFLYGVYIDYYVTMNMDAIAILNDLVGGVKVNVTDDFSQIDPTITKGEMVLDGRQALTYVRTRQGLGDQLNVTRMQRQREYMVGFMSALKKNISDSSTFALKAYEQASPYCVTDCSSSAITALANRLIGYELRDVVAIQGENVAGEQYMEYHVDKDALDRVILKYLYTPKN